MENHIKDKIFSNFDVNGILCKVSYIMVSITIDFPKNTLQSELTDNKDDTLDYKIFEPELVDYKISKEEGINLVLEYMKTKLGLNVKSINELQNYTVKDGIPYILLIDESDRKIYKDNKTYNRFLINPEVVSGSIVFREKDQIESLGNIKEIKGDLGFSGSSIKTLNELTKVPGSFWVSQGSETTKLLSLGKLKFVGRDLNLKNTFIKDLENLEYVGGNLNLRKLELISFGKLSTVKGNILLSKEMKNKFSFENIKIGGKVKYYTD